MQGVDGILGVSVYLAVSRTLPLFNKNVSTSVFPPIKANGPVDGRLYEKDKTFNTCQRLKWLCISTKAPLNPTKDSEKRNIKTIVKNFSYRFHSTPILFTEIETVKTRQCHRDYYFVDKKQWNQSGPFHFVF